MAERIFNGRTALDRRGVAAHTGAGLSTVARWYRERRRTGFPDTASLDAPGDWWWTDEVNAFTADHAARLRARHPALTRGGDPDEMLTSGPAAKILGYVFYQNLPAKFLALADETTVRSDGTKRRRWKRSTIWNYAANRAVKTSTGRPVGTVSGPRKPHPYADDSRLVVALDMLAAARAEGRSLRGLGAELARRLAATERAGQRLIAAALLASEPVDRV